MTRAKRKALTVLIAVSFALCAGSARADVAFSTLGPGDTYDGSFAGQTVNGLNASGPRYVANAFAPSFDGFLSSIDVGITNYDIADGGSGAVVLHLYANDLTTNTPLTSLDLASGPLTATLGTGSTNSALTTFTYGDAPLLLNHNLTYWLVLAPASASTTVNWQASLPAIPGKIGSSGNGTTFQTSDATLEAFRVNVQPIPEPAGWALLCLGSGIVAFAARRKAQ